VGASASESRINHTPVGRWTGRISVADLPTVETILEAIGEKRRCPLYALPGSKHKKEKDRETGNFEFEVHP
jgi:hypothetical protein